MVEDIKNILMDEKKYKESVKLQRIILLAIPYFYFVFGLFFYKTVDINDPMTLSQRGFAILIFLSLFGLSFISSWIKKRLKNVVHISVYFAVNHLAYVAYLNSYDYDIATSLIVTVAIANLFFDGNKLILYLNIITALFVGNTLLLVDEAIIFKISYFIIYMSIALFTYFISFQKFKIKNKLDSIKKEQEILLDNTDVQIWYLKKFDRYGKVNQAHADFLGVKKSELENKKIDKLFDSAVAKKCKKTNKKVFKEKKKLESKEWIDNNGESRCLSITKIPKINEEGKVEFVVCSAKDITEKIENEEKLDLTQFSVDNAPVGIYWITPGGKFEYVNNVACKMLKYSKKELNGKKVSDIDPNYSKNQRSFFWNQIKKKEKNKIETEHKTKNGDIIPVQIINKYIKYKNKEYEFAFVQDISDRIEKEAEIKELLFKDALTNLYNRRFFEEEIERLDTKRQLPISIIMADVNGLKIINDTYGHKKGDEMLVKAANLLKKSLREEDILARHGGDEFAILLPQTNKELAKKILNRIKTEAKKTETEEIPISISFGVATKSKKSEDINDILKQADDAMYQNKLLESKSVKNKIIQSLLSTLSIKSNETKNHAIRMTALAHDLGKKQGLPVSELDRLSLLSLLHDIGKATISEEILTKPEKLTKEEWKIIKKHPETGSRIASASNEFALVADEIFSHHERWDGKGYPRGLRGEDIPYLARIIAIVDTYDVMTNDRPYSKAVLKEEALEEIKKCSGSQFDPELAASFIEMW